MQLSDIGVLLRDNYNQTFPIFTGGLNVQKPAVGQWLQWFEHYKASVKKWPKLLLTRAIVDRGTYATPLISI